MASSVSVPSSLPQPPAKRTHTEMSSSETPVSQQASCAQPSLPAEVVNKTAPSPAVVESVSTPRGTEVAAAGHQILDGMVVSAQANATHNSHIKEKVGCVTNTTRSENCQTVKQPLQPSGCKPIKACAEVSTGSVKPVTQADSLVEAKIPSSGASAGKPPAANNCGGRETQKMAGDPAPAPSCQGSSVPGPASGSAKPPSDPPSATEASQNNSMKPSGDAGSHPATSKHSEGTSSNYKPQLEDGEEPEKKAKIVSSSSKGGKTAEQVLEHMDKTFDQRRKIITDQMPAIPELKELYPDLFTGKQLLLEFQRITKIDIDQKVQEFCVRYATAVIEMARNKKSAAPVLARWEQAKLENDALRQYWDMVTALCLLPLHFGENFVEMVLEIGEDEEVVAQGKIVPTLIARGNIFRTDEFFLIAENTIVQEFEEFTIAFASLYSSYWVFNMEYPETIETTYNYIQRCIVRQREPGSIPVACKNFTKALQKWGKDGK